MSDASISELPRKDKKIAKTRQEKSIAYNTTIVKAVVDKIKATIKAYK